MMYNKMVKKAPNGAIDILKFIAAVMIIFLHSQQHCGIRPDYNSDYVWEWVVIFQVICRMAVPFFFITSGYFLFKKIRNSDNKSQIIGKYCKRILVLYFSWFIINFIWVWNNGIDIQSDNIIKSVIKLIRNIILQNGFGSSWFLMACVWDALIIYALTIKTKNNKFALCISIISYLICLLFTYYRFVVGDNINHLFTVLERVWGNIDQSFPDGLIFFSIGKIIADNEEKIKISRKKISMIFIGVFVLYVIEEITVRYLFREQIPISCTSYAMLPPLTALLFLICLKSNITYRPLYRVLREVSTIIYCSHRTIMWLFQMFYESHVTGSNFKEFVFVFPVTLGLSMVVAYIIIKLSEKYKGLKYLY